MVVQTAMPLYYFHQEIAVSKNVGCLRKYVSRGWFHRVACSRNVDADIENVGTSHWNIDHLKIQRTQYVPAL